MVNPSTTGVTGSLQPQPSTRRTANPLIPRSLHPNTLNRKALETLRPSDPGEDSILLLKDFYHGFLQSHGHASGARGTICNEGAPQLDL